MKRRDLRLFTLLTLLAAVLAMTVVFNRMPDRSQPLAQTDLTDRSPTAGQKYAGELHERFQQAAVMLHAGQHLYALEALQRVLEIAPSLPEAHVNTGFALIGLLQPARARQHFRHAIDVRPIQVNAYYGLALSLEALGELDAALGAMRTFVHLADEQDPYMRRAWAAIWEWQSQRSVMTPDSQPATPVAQVGKEADS